EALVLHRTGQRFGHNERVGAAQPVVFDMNRAVGPARQRFADDLGHARRASRADDDFAGVLFLEAERFFERVSVRLVQFVAGVLLANPDSGFVEARLPLARGYLFDADGDFHLLLCAGAPPPAPVPSPLVAARLCVDRLSAFTTAPGGTVRRLSLRRLSRLGFVSIDCPLSQRLPGAPSGAGAFAAYAARLCLSRLSA